MRRDATRFYRLGRSAIMTPIEAPHIDPLLEAQLKEYLAKHGAGLPQGITALLAVISKSYTSFEHDIETLQKEKAELTERLKKEGKEISRRENHLAASQRIAHVGSWELDLANLDDININPLYWSDETFRIMGFTPGKTEVSNELFFSRVHPDDHSIITKAIETAIASGKPYDIEHRLVLPGGVKKIVHERSDIIFDKKTGKPVKMIGTIQDITAIKNAQRQLEKTNYELQTLFANMQEGFFSIDSQTNQVLQISKACEKIWGYSDDEFFKNPDLWFEIILEEDKHIILANYPVMMAGKSFSQQYRIRHKDGSIKWLESKITPTLNAEGKLIRVDGMTSDISAKKEAEKKITESELLNRTFFEQSLAGVYRTSPDGKVLTCNQAFAAMLGYASPEELKQINAGELYFTSAERNSFIAKLRQHKKLLNYDVVLKCKNGSPLYVLENIILTANPTTGDEFCDGIMINITELKKAEAEFYESEKRYRQIVETAQEGIWTIDENNKTNFVNKKICEILEYTSAEMMGKELYDFMDQEGKEYAIACMERRRRGARENLDIRYVTKGGKNVWTNISANPIFDNDGTYRGSLAMVTDITERKLQEELLQQSEANLRTIFNHTESSFILLDEELKIVSFNAIAQTALEEYGEGRLKEGEPMVNYFSPGKKAYLQEILSKLVAGETVNYEISLRQKEGPNKWYEVRWAGVTNEDKKITGVLITSNDITEKKLAALEREKMTEDLIQRNKDLQQFNYIVSHNLRAPVANILGLSTLLTSQPDGDMNDKKELLDGLMLSTKNLDEIIKDLNFILQVKQEGAHEKKETVHFHQLADDIKISISNIIAKEKAAIHYSFEEVDSLFTIRSYLYSIFYNLILNSIKYKQPDIAPVIRISSIKHKHTVELLFEDNGKGIDINRNEKNLFGLYKRFDTAVEGKGIGLFMVKSQVEYLGGKISVQSKVNKGTTFRLELPL